MTGALSNATDAGPSRFFLLVVAAIYFVIALASVIYASYGLENSNMVATFSNDEEAFVTRMQNYIKAGSRNPHGWHYYGQLYEGTAYYIIRFFQFFGLQPDSQFIGMTLRLESLAGGLLTAFAMYRLSITVGIPYQWALLTPLLFITMPNYIVWMRTMHPDTVQTIFMVAGMTFLMRAATFKNALIATAFTALAFSTKYVGLALLPFCFLPLAMVTLAGDKPFGKNFRDLIVKGLCGIALFILIYAIVDPYGSRTFGTVIANYREMWALLVSTDYEKAPSANPLLWLPILRSELGSIGLGLLTLGTILAVVQLCNDWRRQTWRAVLLSESSRGKLVMLLYVLGLTGYMLATVRLREVRYTFHIMPFVVILSMWGIWEWVKTLNPRPLLVQSGAALLLCFVTWQCVRAFESMAEINSDRRNSEFVKMGAFVAENYQPDTRILHDTYTYIPTKFSNTMRVWSPTRQDIETFKPDLIAFNSLTSGRWAWKEPGTKMADGKIVADRRYVDDKPVQVEALLRGLLADPNWKVVYETDRAVIFGTTKAR